MRRAEAIEIIMRAVRDELVVACNGMIAREVFTFRDRESNFYMIGSMGLALSIGMGVALSRPERTVLVLDGDGNLLMGAGVLASVAAAGLRNLLHIVLDNEVHGSTGGQRTTPSSGADRETVENGRPCGARPRPHSRIQSPVVRPGRQPAGRSRL